MTPVRRRRHRPSLRADVLVSLAVIGALLVAGGLSMRARDGLPGTTGSTVIARFDDLSGLKAHDDVRMAGIRVGQVLDPRTEAGGAGVELALEPGVELRADARAIVRSRGLLGARYVELRPGRSAAPLPRDAAIPVDRTGVSGDLTTILATFDPPTRRALQGLISGGGRGLLGRGQDLNELLGTAPRAAGSLRDVAAAINANPGAARRLTPSLGSLTAATAPVADPLARAVADQRHAAAPFAARRDDVQRLLRSAPTDLRGVRASLAATSPLLDAAGDLLTTARSSLADAPAGLAATAAVLRTSGRPLARATRTLDAVTTTTPGLTRTIRSLPPLLSMLDDLTAASTPLLQKIATIQCDIHSFGTGWASMLGAAVRDRTHDTELGPLTSLRLTATTSPAGAKPAVTAVAGGRLLASNPYPAPCEAGTETLP